VRKLLFFALVAGYAVACPLLILYALGYIVQPSSEELRRTGGIFVASTPPGASLSIDGKPYASKTPLAVLQLRPGPYRIRIDLEGYRPWEETVSVTPGRVTSLNDLLLVPVQRTFVEEAQDWFLDMIPAPGYPYVILRKGSRAEDLVVYDISNRRFVAVVHGEPPLQETPVVACLTIEGSADFLLETGGGASPRIYWVRIRWPQPLLKDLTDVLPQPFRDPQWTVETPEEIYSYNGSSVDCTNVHSATVTNGILSQVCGYGLDGHWLYAITWLRHMLRFDLGQQTRQDLPQFDSAVWDFPTNRFVSVRPFGRDLILLWSQEGRFTAVGSASSQSTMAVRGYQTDSPTGHVLLWQAHRLAILDRKAAGNALSLGWLHLNAEDIQQACFVMDSNNVLYRDGNSIFLASRLHNSEWRVSFVATVRLGTSVYYSEREGKLYYLDPETGRLFSTEIVPHQQILDQIVQQIRQDSGH
jgi:hypothetical protein